MLKSVDFLKHKMHFIALTFFAVNCESCNSLTLFSYTGRNQHHESYKAKCLFWRQRLLNITAEAVNLIIRLWLCVCVVL